MNDKEANLSMKKEVVYTMLGIATAYFTITLIMKPFVLALVLVNLYLLKQYIFRND